jgi:hypothetical protein
MIAEAVRSYPLHKYRFLDITEVAKKVGLKSAPQSSHAEELLVHCYAQASLLNHFAEPQVRRFAVFRRAQLFLVGVTVTALALGVAGTAFHFDRASQVSARIDARERSALAALSESQNILNLMREQKLASDLVRDSSLFYQRQMRTAPAAPGALLREVSTILGEFPRVRLLQIDWLASDDDKALVPYAVVAANGTLEVTANDQRGSAAPSDAVNVADDPNPTWRGANFQSAIIDAAITPFDGDFRAALAEVERIAARLNTVPRLRATVERGPLDVRSTASIYATGNRTGTPPEARFVIRVVRRSGART